MLAKLKNLGLVALLAILGITAVSCEHTMRGAADDMEDAEEEIEEM